MEVFFKSIPSGVFARAKFTRIKKEKKARRAAVRLQIRLKRKAIRSAEFWRRMKVRAWEGTQTLVGLIPQGIKGLFVSIFKKKPELSEKEPNIEAKNDTDNTESKS